ncbi:MAG: SpoIIE family protein phosphatase, partial [Planctomycetota bacterium]|nr:SpoIIE family protein phosphatase [Planctomycetota bacterium]
VDQLAAGDLDAEVKDVNTKDELGRLAIGFNNMTRQIRHQIAALTEESAAREKVESELRIARQIQTDLLPTKFPDCPEFSLHAVNLPALYVAGDFYDFFFTPSGLLNLVIADVSGKGVPAALVMAVTRTVVRNLAAAGHSPAEIARATNRTLLTDTPASMFVTMLLCQYDRATGRLTYVNAGHPPALRLRPGSEPIEACTLQSPLLGVAAEGAMGPFVQGEERLAPGDTLFLYTDGVSESPGSEGGLLRTAGVAQFLRPLAGAAPEAICRRTSDRLDQLCGGHRLDDITMAALRCLVTPSEQPEPEAEQQLAGSRAGATEGATLG